MSQMKALEDENRRLKRMFAEFSMQAELLRETLGKMYGPPRGCKVFVRGRPACVNVSGPNQSVAFGGKALMRSAPRVPDWWFGNGSRFFSQGLP